MIDGTTTATAAEDAYFDFRPRVNGVDDASRDFLLSGDGVTGKAGNETAGGKGGAFNLAVFAGTDGISAIPKSRLRTIVGVFRIPYADMPFNRSKSPSLNRINTRNNQYRG
jgi:hypothetical protein